jgi:hypothetical protein
MGEGTGPDEEYIKRALEQMFTPEELSLRGESGQEQKSPPWALFWALAQQAGEQMAVELEILRQSGYTEASWGDLEAEAWLWSDEELPLDPQERRRFIEERVREFRERWASQGPSLEERLIAEARKRARPFSDTRKEPSPQEMREQLLAQARREAEEILRKAREEAERIRKEARRGRRRRKENPA